ncbi:ABC transporter permease subunit [Lysinibacillus sp. MHQ-1]|nr:ABC transporter permease subunit [Lysinibacillus sp. MHQ-1]
MSLIHLSERYLLFFAATLIAKLIIGEYKFKTITLAFMYPVSRKKLIAAKLAIVMIFYL